MVSAVGTIAAVTLFPFHTLQREPWDPLGATFVGLPLGLVHAFDIVQNVLLFFPLGVALRCCLRSRSRLTALCTVGLSAALFSLSLELAQRLLPTRDPSWIDVISNTGGALIGLAVAFRLLRVVDTVERVLRRWLLRPRPLSLQTTAVLLAVGTLVLAASIPAHRQALLSDWDETFPLSVGNESPGDRPWQGSVSQLEMVPYAMSEAKAAELSRTTDKTLRDDWISSIQFQSVSTPPQVVKTTALTAFDNTTAPGWLRSSTPVSKLIAAIRRSHQFTVHLICAPAASGQNGSYAVEIVSIAADHDHRDFSMAQNTDGKEDILLVRVRNRHTGESGDLPELRVRGVFARGKKVNIVVVYARDSFSAFVDGHRRPESLAFSPGSPLATDGESALGEETLQGCKRLYFAAVMLVCLWLVPGSRGWLRLLAGCALGYVLLNAEWRIAIGRYLTWRESAQVLVAYLAVSALGCAATFLCASGGVHGVDKPLSGVVR